MDAVTSCAQYLLEREESCSRIPTSSDSPKLCLLGSRVVISHELDESASPRWRQEKLPMTESRTKLQLESIK